MSGLDFTGNGASSAIPSQTRTAAFRAALASPVIDLSSLKSLVVAGGIPDQDLSLRSQIWQLLLGYLPLDRSQWRSTATRKEAEYFQFCRELIVDPRTLGRPPADLEAAAAAALKPTNEPSGFSPLQRTTVTQDDHPLSTSNSSRWRAFFADAEIREQIERDVDRTHPDLHFFSGQTEAAQIHRASMRRALFIFAKLNPGLRYVQGMNELMAVLYHTFAVGGAGGGGGSGGGIYSPCRGSGGSPKPFSNSNISSTPLADPLGTSQTAHTPPNASYKEESKTSDDGNVNNFNEEEDLAPSSAEAAAFFTFVDLLGEFRDHFCQQLDNSEVGIRATMSRLSSSLRSFDPVLWTHLERTNAVIPQFYAFRWITTLLTQEFSFPDVLRLWDALLADPGGRTDCLLRVCLAMVLLVREELLKGDFASNLKLLQQYPSMDVGVVLRMADSLRSYKTVIVMEDE